jgi:hypothetical protein
MPAQNIGEGACECLEQSVFLRTVLVGPVPFSTPGSGLSRKLEVGNTSHCLPLYCVKVEPASTQHAARSPQQLHYTYSVCVRVYQHYV